MMLYIIFSVLVLTIILITMLKSLTMKHKIQDSILKRRAMFSAQQQLIFLRLKEILPKNIILTHVSYDSLLTTKFPHTRAKYRNMVADFVILDEQYQVIFIVSLENILTIKHRKDVIYEEALLESAGYQVLHYKKIPDIAELRKTLEKYIKEEDSQFTMYWEYILLSQKNMYLSQNLKHYKSM